MIRQVKTRRVTISSIMGTAVFRKGFEEAMNGFPLEDSWETKTRRGVASEQWSYERGRLFFFWLKAKGLENEPFKQGRRVLAWAQDEYNEATKEKAIL